MKDNAAVKFLIDQARITWLLVRYSYLHICYFCLLVRYALLKVAGVLLIEAVKIEYFIKCLSKEDRVMFAASIAVSIYVLMLVAIIRL